MSNPQEQVSDTEKLETLIHIAKEWEALIRSQLVTVGIFEADITVGIAKAIKRLSEARQHGLSTIEEMSSMRRRIYMLEAGLTTCVEELRIRGFDQTTVRHYERLQADDFTLGIGEKP